MKKGPPPPYPGNSTIALLGKRVQLKNIIGNMILDTKDAFITVSDDFEWKVKKQLKIIKTPDFFDEKCPSPDQQIIDLMALSSPGPTLFILAIDSENTQEEKIIAQIRQLQNTFGEKITQNLAVTLPDIESFQSLKHLKEDFCIQLTIANENLAEGCEEWCSRREPFLYDYNSYIKDALNRRKTILERRSGDANPPYNHWKSGVDSSCVSTSQFFSAEQQALEHGNFLTEPPVMAKESEASDTLESPTRLSRSLVSCPLDQRKLGKNHHQSEPLKQQSDCSAIENIMFHIVLLGKAGTGKSTSANTILAAVSTKYSKYFKSEASSLPVTTRCQEKSIQLPSGIILTVVDTPDFLHEHLENHQEQITKCKKYCQSEPGIVLLVLQLSRFTDGEKEILKILEERLGCEIREKTVVLFTHGDDLTRERNNLEEFINEREPLKNIVDMCGNRFHVFNNKLRDSKQVMELFNKIPNREYYFSHVKKKTDLKCSVC